MRNEFLLSSLNYYFRAEEELEQRTSADLSGSKNEASEMVEKMLEQLEGGDAPTLSFDC